MMVDREEIKEMSIDYRTVAIIYIQLIASWSRLCLTMIQYYGSTSQTIFDGFYGMLGIQIGDLITMPLLAS
jgi:hypothetical protein